MRVAPSAEVRKSTTILRKISRNLSVIENGAEPQTLNISARALLINLVLLYGFAATGQIITKFSGVYRRGFFCNDESIQLPYKSDTFSTTQLILYSILVNVIAVIVVEYLRMRSVENQIEHPTYKWRDSHIHILFVRFITYIGYSQIGFIVNLTITTTTKNIVGRLRPHFLDVCRPDLTNCTGNPGDADMVNEARKSFFSGHSSMSMYASVWTALYIQARLVTATSNKIIIPLLQTVIIIFGLSISYSRINDHMHHWSDVLIGILVGSFIAVYTCYYWTGIMTKKAGYKLVNQTTPSGYGSTELITEASSQAPETNDLEIV